MATREGHDYSETLEGTDDADSIYGFGGDDLLKGYGGDDEIFGGSGDDEIYGGADDDDIYGGSGANNLYGGSGADYFIQAARTLSSSTSDDYIGDFAFGVDRVDVRDWGASDFSQIEALLTDDADGNVVFNAAFNGKNHFVTIADVAPDQLESGDFVFSDDAGGEVEGTAKADVLFGSDDADILSGFEGKDKLLGGDGNDAIYGDAGKDKIWGGDGIDSLTGGSSADRFIFASSKETANKHGDHITDFTPDEGDRIDVSDIDAIKGGQDSDFDWIGKSKSFDEVGQLRYSYKGDTTVISGNTDTDSKAEFQIVLDQHIKLHEGDFIV